MSPASLTAQGTVRPPSWKPSTSSANPGPSLIGHAFDRFFECAKELLQCLTSARHSDESWIELQQILESLPLTTTEFGQALNELNNAHGYARRGELGAAQYELRMLQRRMQRFAMTT